MLNKKHNVKNVARVLATKMEFAKDVQRDVLIVHLIMNAQNANPELLQFLINVNPVKSNVKLVLMVIQHLAKAVNSHILYPHHLNAHYAKIHAKHVLMILKFVKLARFHFQELQMLTENVLDVIKHCAYNVLKINQISVVLVEIMLNQ